jgi:hypothetical protein
MGGDAASQCQVTPPKKRGRPPTKQLVHAHADTPGMPFLVHTPHTPHRAHAHVGIDALSLRCDR